MESGETTRWRGLWAVDGAQAISMSWHRASTQIGTSGLGGPSARLTFVAVHKIWLVNLEEVC